MLLFLMKKSQFLIKLCEYSVHVPLDNMFIVESIHSVIFHYVLIELNEIFNKENFD